VGRLTSLSCLRLALSLVIWVASSASAAASLSFLGATTLMTRSYTSSARTHLHRPSHALDAFFTNDGSKSGFDMYLDNTYIKSFRGHKAHRVAQISITSAFSQTPVTLRDHEYEASASRGVPVSVPSFAGTHCAWPGWVDLGSWLHTGMV